MGHLKTASGSRHIQQLESRTLLSLAGPDPSFGAGGTVDVPAHGQIAFLPNGKILTIGSVVKTVDDDNEFMTVVSRLNADGTKDLTFGTSGSISYPGPDGYATIVRDRYFINGDGYTFDGVAAGGLPGGTDLDALPDGGFLITSFSNSKEYLTKFDVHEKQDVLFGTNGRVDVTPTQQGQSQQLAVISPNGILVASVDSKSVQRYTFAGKLDTTFGTNGTATFGFELGHLLPQSDGKIVVVSDVVVKVPHMIRLNADGSLDATFGTSGTVNLVDRVGQPLHLKNALLDPQDRIVITAGLGDPGIYRYSPSGAPEHAPYNGTLTASNGLRLTADTIAADANGRILIGNLANLTRLDIVKPMVIGRDHVLYISGATGNDHIAVTAGTSGKIKITLNGSTIDQSTSGIVGININGSEGNNTIDYTLALPVTIRAGGGNDSITSGGGNDTIFSGDGADTIASGSGNDSIEAGLGNNVIDLGSGNDSAGARDDIVMADTNKVSGGDGNKNVVVQSKGQSTIDLGVGDSIVQTGFRSGTDHITIAGGNNNVEVGGGTDFLTIGGSGKNKVLISADSIGNVTTGAGDDTINVDGGGTVNTGGGNDSILVGTGLKTTVFAGIGDDAVKVIAGDLAEIHGGDGNDSLTGFDGRQILWGEGGSDTIRGGVGDDSMFGGGGRDSIYGGDGNDSIRGGPGNDTLYGEAGDDKLYGEAEDDSLFGGEGNDRIDAGSGRDYVNASDGDDVIFAADGEKDSLFGGRGLDHAAYDKGLDALDGIEKPL